MTLRPGVLDVPAPRVRLGRRWVSWFQVCGAGGVVAGLAAAVLGAGLRGLPLLPVLVLAGTAGAIFLLLAIGTALVVAEGRLTWFHHQLGIVAGCGLVLAITGRPVLGYLDLVGAGLLAFGVVGRVGCLLVGCCHGRPARHGVVYGPAHVEAGLELRYAGVVLMPVQLLEAVASASLLIACLATLGSTAAPGATLSLSLVGYAAARIGLERLRGDARPTAAGLSEAQWTAWVVALGAIGLWATGSAAVPTPLAGLALLVVGAAAGLGLLSRRSPTTGPKVPNPSVVTISVERRNQAPTS